MIVLNRKLVLTISQRVGAVISLGVCCGVAHAGHAVDLPEPGVLSLMAIGGAVGVVMYIRKKQNK